jgi:hypothetical protein
MEFEHNWEFETTEEIENIFTDGFKDLNDLIVDIALDNLKTSIKEIPVVSILAKDEDTIYDIIIDRVDMPETLKQNLQSMEKYEDYERCQKIVNALDYLNLDKSNEK